MADTNYGLVTEQGYPAGQFGFKPVSEETRKQIEESEKNKSTSNTNKKEEE